MTPLWLLLGLSSLLPTELASQADGAAGASQGELVRIGPIAAPRVPRRFNGPDEFDRDAWRTALTQRDLDARERAFERLVGQAPGPARAALEEWAGDGNAPELAWTSRLALRELTRAARARRLLRGPAVHWLRAPPDEFHPGPVELFVQLEHKLEQLMRAAPRAGEWTQVPGGSGSSQVFQLHMGPNGVKLEVREVEDGAESSETYEAATLPELLAAHPELKLRLNAVRVFPQGTERDIHDLLARLRVRLVAPQAGAGVERSLPTDILGVYAVPRTKATPNDRGALLVERIEPDTVAAVLDIRRGDFLLELNGVALATVDDVTRGLAAREPGADLRLTIERGGRERTLIWKPSPEGQ
ncbi:MAG: PDZ domain-containing protein [Planctomycetota bacterium]|nr:MAG: PDZ domain-containing protein [Planctomycetota bacterium]